MSIDLFLELVLFQDDQDYEFGVVGIQVLNGTYFKSGTLDKIARNLAFFTVSGTAGARTEFNFHVEGLGSLDFSHGGILFTCENVTILVDWQAFVRLTSSNFVNIAIFSDTFKTLKISVPFPVEAAKKVGEFGVLYQCCQKNVLYFWNGIIRFFSNFFMS